jgi:hypothetical protein
MQGLRVKNNTLDFSTVYPLPRTAADPDVSSTQKGLLKRDTIQLSMV